jgi:hypothetical protein
LIGKGQDGISYAGDRLDRLAWDDIGKAGYVFFGDRKVSMYAQVPDSENHLPPFIAGLAPIHIGSPDGAYLPDPLDKNILHHTGSLERKSGSIVSFIIGKDAPASFRLGVMVDNAHVFANPGGHLWVTDAKAGAFPTGISLMLETIRKGMSSLSTAVWRRWANRL